MFTHIMVGSNDPEKSAAFYNAALGALGVSPAQGERLFYMHKGGAFGVGKPRNGEAATCANGGTIGFQAESKRKSMRSMRRAAPMAAHVTARRVSAKTHRASLMALICATPMAIKSVPSLFLLDSGNSFPQ